MGLGPAQAYLAKYNGFTLPGYVQKESFDSVMRLADHYAPYADGSESEYLGLQNKMLQLTLKVWEQDYATCKEQVQEAAVMLRSKRDGFAPLYLQYTDRYYEALVGTIRIEKTAGESVRTLDYQVDFTCKPWLVSEASYTISGNALNGAVQTISTVGRTLSDGGWTFANARISGTSVTISGYLANGDQAGFISVSGTLANLTVDSQNFTATTSNGTINRNAYMKTINYQLWVGPEVTYFTVSGAQLLEITYQNRWYL